MRLMLLLVLFSGAAFAQPTPRAVIADLPASASNPAAMAPIVIVSHAAGLNAVMYSAAGVGRHPTLLLLHGFPGNEQNLDLAQAARRAGWNVLTFHYRGSWGSPGNFRFAQALEDGDAILSFIRDSANVRKLRIDTSRIVVAGHSMGGWVTAVS